MRILLAIMATVFAYVILYSPQPLLPFLAGTFGVDKSQAALLITVTMLPMSIAPLSYGYLLESLSATKLLRWAILLLAVTVLAFQTAIAAPVQGWLSWRGRAPNWTVTPHRWRNSARTWVII